MPVKFSVGLKPLKTVPHLKTDYALQVQEQRCKQNISISAGSTVLFSHWKMILLRPVTHRVNAIPMTKKL